MTARRHKRRNLSVRVGETPTRERRNQGALATEVIDRDCEGKALICRYKVLGDIPLDAYLLRGKISEGAYQAGLKFRSAYMRAVLRVHVEDAGAGAHGDPEVAALTPIYSVQILNAAYAVLSPRQKALLIDVCGHDLWAGGTVNIKTMRRGLEVLAALWHFR